MSSRYVSAFNSTDSPVLVSEEGHLLGGGEYGTVRRADPVVREAFDRGALTVVSDPGDLTDASKEASAAIRATREANGDSAPGDSPEDAKPDAKAQPAPRAATRPDKQGS